MRDSEVETKTKVLANVVEGKSLKLYSSRGQVSSNSHWVLDWAVRELLPGPFPRDKSCRFFVILLNHWSQNPGIQLFLDDSVVISSHVQSYIRKVLYQFFLIPHRSHLLEGIDREIVGWRAREVINPEISQIASKAGIPIISAAEGDIHFQVNGWKACWEN